MPAICDQFGRNINSSWALYPNPANHPQDNRPKPLVRSKIYENQTPYTRWQQVNYSRVLATQVTGIDAALGMKAKYAVGDAWHIAYLGKNPVWGEQMEEMFHECFYRCPSIMGPTWDWHSLLRTLCRTFDVEADYGVWFDEKSGQVSILDYSRFGTGIGWNLNIGQGLDQCRELGNAPYGYNYANGYYSGWGSYLPFYIINDTKSPFDGQRIIDGVIVDQNLRLLGFRILGYSDQGQMTYADVPKDSIHFNFEVGDWLNQLRGIPSLTNLLDDANSVSDINYFWKQGVQLASQKMVWRESLDGRPGNNVQETVVDTGVPDPNSNTGATIKKLVAIEDAPAGLVELENRKGEKLGTLDLNRPSMEERELVKLLETAYFHKHWPRCLIYAEDSARAGSRSIAQQVQVTIRQRQMTLERTARWIAERRIGWAMANGVLPRNDNLFDPYTFGFSLPGKYTVDEGNDGKQMLTMLGRCCISRGTISNDMGYQFKKVLKNNVADVDALATEAEGLSERHEWMTEMEALNRLDNNGNVNQPVMQEPDATEETDDTPPGTPAKPQPAKPAKKK